MVPRENVLKALNHKSGPIPWIELRVDNEIAGRAVGKPLDCVNDVKDWIEMAQRVGLSCANVRALNRFGTVDRSKQGVSFVEVVPLLTDWAAVERIGHPLPVESEIIAKIRRAKENQPQDQLAVFGVALGCVDPTVLSMGFEHCCTTMHDDPKLVEAVLDLYTDYAAALLEIFSGTPEIDVIWVTDDMAFNTGPYISPRMFKELFLPRYRRLAEKINKPWLLHSDGNLRPILADLLDLGINALHPIQPGPMDILQLKKDIGDRVCLAGNLDLELLAIGTPDQVRAEVYRLAETCGEGGGYMLSSSNSIPDWAKPENFLAMGEALQQFNNFKFGLGHGTS